MNTRADQEETEQPGWLQLVLFPLLLVAYIRQLFAARTEELHAKRRTHTLPAAWQDLIPDLRNAEWPVHAMKAEGARLILRGEPLDLAKLAIPIPTENQLWIPPTSAQQMHQRMLDLTRFHADPERYIRRHAERIRRAAEQGARRAAATTTISATHAAGPGAGSSNRNNNTTTIISATNRRAGQRVRAPPWRPLFPIPHSPSPLGPPLQRPRPHVQRPNRPSRPSPPPPPAAKSLSTGANCRRVPLSNRRHNES